MKPAVVKCLVAAVAITLAACGRPDSGSAVDGPRRDSLVPGSTIDSLIPIGESLRRFRNGLPEVTQFAHSAPSRDSLVRAVFGAVARSSEAELLRISISRAEYGYLYYPTSLYSAKPYELAPDIAWMLSEQGSDKGRKRLMQRLGGQILRLDGVMCNDSTAEGDNRLWRNCTVTYTDPTTSVGATRRLFGSIIEREGHFKLLSFANDF